MGHFYQLKNQILIASILNNNIFKNTFDFISKIETLKINFEEIEFIFRQLFNLINDHN